MTSPTQRTLAALRADGWTCQVVERWNQYAKVRQDLYGCIDILCLRLGEILGVQACAGASHAARRAKALAEPRLGLFLTVPGAQFHIVSWAKQGPRGKRKVWVRRVEVIALEDAVRAAVATGEVGE